MAKKLVSLFALTLFILCTLTSTALSKSRVKDEKAEKLMQYGFMYEKKLMPVMRESSQVLNKEDTRTSLGTSGDGISPGAIVAHTWYERQQPSSMGRMIDWRWPNPHIHFTYSQMFAVGGRLYASYNVYDPISGTWPLTADVGCPVSPPQGAAGGRAGGANIDVRPDGGSVVACHHREIDDNTWPYSTAVYIDQTASYGIYCGFGNGSHASNDLATSAAVEPPPEFGWPKVEYHINGSDTVIYALSWEMVEYNMGTLVLFRNVGSNLQGTWEAHIIDTIFYPVHAITSSRVSRKVACCWLEEAAEGVEGNNDVWYLVSDDMGATWDLNDKINVTNYQSDEPGFRAWIELSCLYDSYDHLHIIWNASVYDGDGTEADSRSCYLLHWAEHTAQISAVHNATWDPLLNCGTGGPNVLNIGKINITESNNRLYVIWIQWGDPLMGDSTDCMSQELSNSQNNANGDIYLSVSHDLDGSCWDFGRNITNTKTPNCDTTIGNECDNESWPSMSRIGMDENEWTGLDWGNASEAFSVNPGVHNNSEYMDVLYINDKVPGTSPLVGTAEYSTISSYNPIKWFRLPAVDTNYTDTTGPCIGLEYSPKSISSEGISGEEVINKIIASNNSCFWLRIHSIEFDPSDMSDWCKLETVGWDPLVGIGKDDKVIITLKCNKEGLIKIKKCQRKILKGHVIINWSIYDNNNKQRGPYESTISVIHTIEDDSCVTIISTNLLSLYISPFGNIGYYSGYSNMDFFNSGLDCDDSSNYRNGEVDTIPGNASVYLGDASPVILTAEIIGSDTNVTASWAIFGDGFDSENGFLPVEGEAAGGIKLTEPIHFVPMQAPNYDCFHTGSFLTVDSHLVVEKTYYAPTADVSFIISMMRIFSFDGAFHNGLIIGEAFDWDIPSDTGVYNGSGTYPVNDLIYMYGGEWDEPHGDSLECTNNDTRAGGAARIGYYTQTEYNSNPDIIHSDPIWGGYAELNENYVYPRKVLYRDDDYYYIKLGFSPIELYRNMMDNSGLNAQPSSVIKDQHIVLTYFNNYTLGASDTLLIWTVMATVPPSLSKDAVNDLVAEINDGKAWLNANIADLKTAFTGCCVGQTGNADCAGGGEDPEEPDISDIVRIIDFLYISHDPLCCLEEADVDASGPANPEDPFSAVDISDIVFLIDHLYLSHKALMPCP